MFVCSSPEAPRISAAEEEADVVVEEEVELIGDDDGEDLDLSWAEQVDRRLQSPATEE